MSARLLIVRAEQVVTARGVIEQGAVRIEGGRILAVDRAARFPDLGSADRLEGAVLLPGFIDLHMHGYGGHAFGAGLEETRAALWGVAASGVTTCYAALGAGPSLAAIAQSVADAAAMVGVETGGARLAGAFLEGPYISVEKKGAWNPAHLRLPDVRELRELVAAGEGRLQRINVAPELPGALDFIRAARAVEVVVSLGHSNATYDEALAGVAAGATIANHTFNAMSALDHRSPGLVGAALTCDDLLAELILDGVHVHPAAARTLLRARGVDGIALISDSAAIAGLPDGVYRLAGHTVIVRDSICRLADGTLAGSVSPFDRDVRNAPEMLGCGLVELAALSSGNAARAMGIDGRTGAVAPGLDADLVLLDDELHVLATIVGGQVVYRRRSAPPLGARA